MARLLYERTNGGQPGCEWPAGVEDRADAQNGKAGVFLSGPEHWATHARDPDGEHGAGGNPRGYYDLRLQSRAGCPDSVYRHPECDGAGDEDEVRHRPL